MDKLSTKAQSQRLTNEGFIFEGGGGGGGR